MKLPVYLDNNSTSALDPRVLEEMLPTFGEHFGNPSSPHEFGWYAAELVEIARERIAAAIGAKAKEIIFTSGATESNNLALWGTLGANSANQEQKIVSCSTEHRAILDPLEHIAAQKRAEVQLLETDREGNLLAQQLRSALNSKPCLVSLMAANNEVGTCHNLKRVAEITPRECTFHTDAAQALGKLPLNVNELGVDLMSLSAHKVNGPKGVGALYVREGVESRISAQLFGGGQESGLRAGTLNVPAIVGFGKACELADHERERTVEHLRKLSRRLLDNLEAEKVCFELNGPKENRLPGNVSLAFSGTSSSSLISALSGSVAISASSACSSESGHPSHVLRALNLENDRVKSSVRIGIGKFNTADEIDFASGKIIEAIKKLRK